MGIISAFIRMRDRSPRACNASIRRTHTRNIFSGVHIDGSRKTFNFAGRGRAAGTFCYNEQYFNKMRRKKGLNAHLGANNKRYGTMGG